MDKKTVLVIAPHMDDEVLGCGGVIAKHQTVGDNVTVIFVAHRIYNHQFDKEKNKIERKHTLKAKSILKYKDAIFLDLDDERLDGCVQEIIIPLEKHVPSIKPEIAYIPFKGDNNQDHRAVYEAARIALRATVTPFIEAIYMYEVSSSTEQSPPLPENYFMPNYYVDIKRQIDKKLAALKCYETEKRDYPHPRSLEAVRILTQKRGIEIGFEYAEAFMTLRRKWR